MSSTFFRIDSRIDLEFSYCFEALETVLEQVFSDLFYGVLHLILSVSSINTTFSTTFFSCASFSFLALISSINRSKANGFLSDSSNFPHKSFISSSWTVPCSKVLKNILYLELEIRSSSMTGVDLLTLVLD